MGQVRPGASTERGVLGGSSPPPLLKKNHKEKKALNKEKIKAFLKLLKPPFVLAIDAPECDGVGNPSITSSIINEFKIQIDSDHKKQFHKKKMVPHRQMHF